MTATNRGPAVVSSIMISGLSRQADVIFDAAPVDHPARPALMAVLAIGASTPVCPALIDTMTPCAQEQQEQYDLQILAAVEFAQTQFDNASALIEQHPWRVADSQCRLAVTLLQAACEATRTRHGFASELLIEVDSTKRAVAKLPNVFLDTAERALLQVGSGRDDAKRFAAAVSAFEIAFQQADKAVNDVIALLSAALTAQVS